jgi:hypothetical protein
MMTMSKHKNRELSRENHTKPRGPETGGDPVTSPLARWASILWTLAIALPNAMPKDRQPTTLPYILAIISPALGVQKPENKKKCAKPKRLRMNSITYASGNLRKTRHKPKKTRLKPTKTRLNPAKLPLARRHQPRLPSPKPGNPANDGDSHRVTI